MKAKVLLGLLVNYLAVSPSLAAVTWKTVGCEGVTHNGVTVDAMWDNALLMAQTAQTSINTITSGKILPRSTTGRIADNARSMFGIDFTWLRSLGSAAQSTLSDNVLGVYSGAEALLSADGGYLFCNGNSLQYGVIGDYMTGAWYYSIPGTNDAVILTYTAGSGMVNAKNPCEDGLIAGQTFTGRYLSSTENGNQYTTMTGILLCMNQIPSKYAATLSAGFTVSNNKGNADDYVSVAGTILHEMIHALNTNIYQDQNDPSFKDGYAAYGVSKCMYLAKNLQAAALVNPDNYRIFAEMSMSPKTVWQPPSS